jgi:very-short-patch-repair endonuclease
MTTQKPGCLASLLRMFGLGKQDSGITVRYLEPDKLPYRLRDDFLSSAEKSFFQVLKTMIGDRLIICPQVSLAALFYVPRSESFQTYQNKIDRKRVDFLLCDPKTLKPVFAIELDDSSHERPDRQERDAFVEEVFEAAELPLVRVPAKQAYNTRELIALFQAATQEKSAGNPIERPSASPKVEPPVCPKCGIPMMLRTAKRGNTPGKQFYGCPNYPRCQVVIPITLSGT